MEYSCGPDVAIEETAVCVVDDRGEVHLTVKVASEPEALFAVLKPFVTRLRRVGHEAGSLSPWLHPELKKLGLPVICLETQHVRAAMAAQRNKTDEKDALGIAHIMRTGWFRAPHVKTEGCYRMRLLLPVVSLAPTAVVAPLMDSLSQRASGRGKFPRNLRIPSQSTLLKM